MAPHIPKKRKTNEDQVEEEEHSTKAPIVFKTPGLNPDTCIVVFDKEFHVHSTILKLYSAYFRTFLDSPDKEPAPASARWKYSYVAVIDEDEDGWGLYPEAKKVSTILKLLGATRTFQQQAKKPEDESEAFRKLLCAMYRIRTSISSIAELERMTSQADFFCCLPAVSSLLDSSAWLSPGLSEHEGRCFRTPDLIGYLKISLKLRHPFLFKDLAILAVSDWDCESDPDRFSDLGKDASKILTLACLRIRQQQAKVAHLLLRTSLEYPDVSFKYDLRRLEDSDTQAHNYILTRDYHERLYQLIKSRRERSPFGDIVYTARCEVMDHLEHELKYLVATTDNFEFLKLDAKWFLSGQYYCASIKDEELPWDTTQTDW